jgi:hypothetical protein
MWDVVYLPEAESERLMLPKVERNALIHAVEKLETFGPQLGYPHTSARGFDRAARQAGARLAEIEED